MGKSLYCTHVWVRGVIRVHVYRQGSLGEMRSYVCSFIGAFELVRRWSVDLDLALY